MRMRLNKGGQSGLRSKDLRYLHKRTKNPISGGEEDAERERDRELICSVMKRRALRIGPTSFHTCDTS
jgi:hypothetical protein